MSDRYLLATFEYEDDLLAATEESRLQGHPIVDVFTPYAIHGLDRAMGLKPSRLTWVCFLCGLAGALLALWFQHWIAAVSWPLDVGGKPWNSLPSHIPVTFELMVLFAGFGSVFALLGVSRLFPGKKAQMPSVDITNDKFILILDEANSQFDLKQTRNMLERHHAVAVEERLANQWTGSEGGPDR